MSKTGIKVKMVGEDGNAFACLGRCRQAMRRAGKLEMWNEFNKEATSGDYNHLLATLSDWFDVCFGNEDKDDEYEEDED